MTNLTASLLLPCQTSTDDPCLFDETWCELVRLVGLEFDRLDAIRDRMVPAVPAVAWDFLGPLTVAAGSFTNIPVDSVDFDTDDMFNPDLSAFRVFPRRTGFYAATAHISLLDGGSTDDNTAIYITSGRFGPSVFGGGNVTGSVINDDYPAFAPGSGTTDSLDTNTVIRVTTANLIGTGLGYGIGYECGGGTTGTITAARFQMYWLRDL